MAEAVPLSTPVAVLKVTPVGSAPVSESVGAGNPVAVTVNVPAVPTVNPALFALVIAGARSTVSVNVCDTVPAVFVALKVIV